MPNPRINTPADGRCGYIAFSHNGQQAEVWADTSFAASELARTYFKPPKSKRHLVTVHLCEVNGQQSTFKDSM